MTTPPPLKKKSSCLVRGLQLGGIALAAFIGLIFLGSKLPPPAVVNPVDPSEIAAEFTPQALEARRAEQIQREADREAQRPFLAAGRAQQEELNAEDRARRSAEAEEAARQQIADAVKWPELHAIYGVGSDSTDLARDEAWKRFKGREVHVTGEVADVSKAFGNIVLGIRMEKSTLTSDLRITLQPSQEEAALKLAKGDTVTVLAILDRWGTLLSITADHGLIISVPLLE